VSRHCIGFWSCCVSNLDEPHCLSLMPQDDSQTKLISPKSLKQGYMYSFSNYWRWISVSILTYSFSGCFTWTKDRRITDNPRLFRNSVARITGLTRGEEYAILLESCLIRRNVTNDCGLTWLELFKLDRNGRRWVRDELTWMIVLVRTWFPCWRMIQEGRENHTWVLGEVPNVFEWTAKQNRTGPF